MFQSSFLGLDPPIRFLMILRLVCVAFPFSQAVQVLRLIGSKPDTGGWPIGKTLNWMTDKAVQEIKDSGNYPFDIQVSWSDDECTRNVGMKQLISKVTNESAPAYHGIVGAGCSGVCAGLAEISDIWGLPLLSWGCASPKLSEKSQFPYFARVSGTTTAHNIGWAVTMEYFGWRRAGVLVEEEESGLHVSAMIKTVEWLNTAKKRIELVVRRYVASSAASATGIAKQASLGVAAIKEANVRIVWIAAYEKVAAICICALSKAGMVGPQWIYFSYSWFAPGFLTTSAPETNCLEAELLEAGEGLIASTDMTWSYNTVDLTPGGLTAPQLREQYTNGSTSGTNDYAALAYDAIYVWANAVQSYLRTEPDYLKTWDHKHAKTSTMSALYLEIIRQELVGASGKVVFDVNGDRSAAAEIHQLSNNVWLSKGTCDPGSCTFANPFDFGMGKVLATPNSSSWTDGSLPRGGPRVCSPGSVAVGEQCSPCPINSYHDAKLGVCQLCPHGTDQPLEGKVFCTQCPVGSHSNENITKCHACQKGFYQEHYGSSVCNKCLAGTFAKNPGQESCSRCPVGSFAKTSGATACESCESQLIGGTTLFPGVDNGQACICGEGTYRLRETQDSVIDRCIPCEEGLVCQGEMDRLENRLQNPLQKEKFSVSKQDWPGQPLKYIVECENVRKCPGSTELGSCPENREVSRSCDYCMLGYHDHNGTCEDCGNGHSAAPIVLTILFAFVAAGLIYFFGTRDVSVRPHSLMTVAITSGLAVNTMQVMGIFRDLEVDWVEPIVIIFKIFQVLMFRVELLNPGCFFGTNAPETQYIGTLLTHPLFAALLLGFWAFGRKFSSRVLTKGHLWNMQGLVLVMFYIALVMVCLLPWQCRENLIGAPSVVVSRATQCWETTDHLIMLVASVIGLLIYVVGFTSIVVWATMQYPKRVLQPGGGSFIRSWRFLFYRFSAPCYYYGSVYLLRNLLIALIPVILVNTPSAQLMMMVLVITGMGAVQSWLRPWRTCATNYLDMACTVAVTMVLCGGAMLMQIPTRDGMIVIQVIFAVIAVLVFFSILVVMTFNIYKAFFPRKSFEIFLCHYKLASAVLARWFKLNLEPLTSGDVFLDSDALSRLDKIIETVAYETKTLLVILSKETLSRIWCGGEITSGERHNVKIVCVACTDYHAPSDEFIDGLDDHWTPAQMNELSVLGIKVADVKEAYRLFRNRPLIIMDRSLPSIEHKKVIDQVCHSCNLGGIRKSSCVNAGQASNSMSTSHFSITHKTKVFIYSDEKNEEAFTTSMVLVLMLQREQFTVAHSDNQTMDIARTIQCFIPLLTPGILASLSFSSMVSKAFEYNIDVLSVVASSAFVFPTSAFWKDLAAGQIVKFCNAGLHGAGKDKTITAYQKLFNVLALRFSPDASDVIQNAEVSSMCVRIKAVLDKTLVSLPLMRLYSPASYNRMHTLPSVPSSRGSQGTGSTTPPVITITKEQSQDSLVSCSCCQPERPEQHQSEATANFSEGDIEEAYPVRISHSTISHGFSSEALLHISESTEPSSYGPSSSSFGEPISEALRISESTISHGQPSSEARRISESNLSNGQPSSEGSLQQGNNDTRENIQVTSSPASPNALNWKEATAKITESELEKAMLSTACSSGAENPWVMNEAIANVSQGSIQKARRLIDL